MSSPSTPFPATRWTLLHKLRNGSEADARAALETLCKAYWFPLYAVARFKKLSEHDAQDAVQGFFLALLQSEIFSKADQTQGKLRNLLLRSFENYCVNEWRRSSRLKRGGGVEHLELIDAATAEERYSREAHAQDIPVETLYNREWARSVLERSLDSLRKHYHKRGQSERFELMAKPLMLEDDDVSMTSLAEAAGMSDGAFRTAVHRLRAHYAQHIEHELATMLDTNDPDAIREEMLELFRAFN